MGHPPYKETRNYVKQIKQIFATLELTLAQM
jgi:hypothetical protein